jgi:hypothetical protein
LATSCPKKKMDSSKFSNPLVRKMSKLMEGHRRATPPNRSGKFLHDKRTKEKVEAHDNNPTKEIANTK